MDGQGGLAGRWLRRRTVHEVIPEVYSSHSNEVDPDRQLGPAGAGVPGVRSDSVGRMAAQVKVRWPSEEWRMRCLDASCCPSKD